MLIGWQAIAGAALGALVVGLGGGWRLGTWQGEAARSTLEQQLQAARGLADTRRVEIEGARERVRELEADVANRRESPAIEYITREIEREVEGPPQLLPAGACATDRFGRLLDTLSASAGADDPRRARADSRVPARAPAPAPAAVPDPPAGYITAAAFRRWSIAAEHQYRTALTRDADWYRFVRTLPCVADPSRPRLPEIR